MPDSGYIVALGDLNMHWPNPVEGQRINAKAGDIVYVATRYSALSDPRIRKVSHETAKHLLTVRDAAEAEKAARLRAEAEAKAEAERAEAERQRDVAELSDLVTRAVLDD
jgi:hypothetical protein